MAGEPSNTELAWRLEEIRRLHSELVSRAEYSARLEAAEHRFGEIAADVQALGRRLDDHERIERENRMGWRTILYTSVPATVVAVAAILVQVWLSGRH